MYRAFGYRRDGSISMLILARRRYVATDWRIAHEMLNTIQQMDRPCFNPAPADAFGTLHSLRVMGRGPHGSGMYYVRRSPGGETDDHRTRCAGFRLNNGAGLGPCQHDHRSSVRRGLRTSTRADCRGRTGTALSVGRLGPGILASTPSSVDLGRWWMALRPPAYIYYG
jgi:hypothetical protein